MKTALYSFCDRDLIKHPLSHSFDEKEAQLVLCFGSKQVMLSKDVFYLLEERFPGAIIAICSTAGEIYHTQVMDDSLSITAIRFDDTPIKAHSVGVNNYENSYEAGKALLREFDSNDLAYVLILSDGSKVNGSELVRGINEVTKKSVLATGGLAGDGSNFHSTLVGLNSRPEEGLIAGIGFYGSKIKISHGSKGGWEMFGLEKKVTASNRNVVFEIDNTKALELYKKYLGPEAASLPGSALLFPLAVKLPGEEEPIVRTILSIDEAAGSMTFAGDIPVGANVRFMKANFDKLTHAASEAASQTINGHTPQLALLVSCVGRKLILQSRTEEEVETVNEMFGHKTLLTGFYSYGEISPLAAGKGCQLHNQTMTITGFYEI